MHACMVVRNNSLIPIAMDCCRMAFHSRLLQYDAWHPGMVNKQAHWKLGACFTHLLFTLWFGRRMSIGMRPVPDIIPWNTMEY